MGTLRLPAVLLEHILFKICEDVTLSKQSCPLTRADFCGSVQQSSSCLRTTVRDGGTPMSPWYNTAFFHLMRVTVVINIHTSIATSYADLHADKTAHTVAASGLMNEGQDEAEVQRPQLQGAIKASLIC